MKKKNNQTSLSSRLVWFFVLFVAVLTVLYFVWQPVAPLYYHFRYWSSYKLLNLAGYYPVYALPSNAALQGEFFSFLPFLSLMICTFKKKIISHWKTLFLVLIMIMVIEIMGKFLERFYALRPVYLFYVLSIFFLASARVALPFVSWWISMQKHSVHLF